MAESNSTKKLIAIKTKGNQMRYEFLPANYEAPKSSGNYFKLEEGENRIRILSRPILGWEDWIDKKPVRYRMDNKPAMSHDPKKAVRHFWSMIAWNYAMNAIQILHITQSSIQKAIEVLSKDEDWGAPYGYDIKIYKSGNGVDTEYSVNPTAPKPISQDILDAFNKKPCNLEALYTNADPFAASAVITQLATIQQVQSGDTKPVSKENPLAAEHIQNARNLESMLNRDDSDDMAYRDRILKYYKVSAFEYLNKETLDTLQKDIHQRMNTKVKAEIAKKVS